MKAKIKNVTNKVERQKPIPLLPFKIFEVELTGNASEDERVLWGFADSIEDVHQVFSNVVSVKEIELKYWGDNDMDFNLHDFRKG